MAHDRKQGKQGFSTIELMIGILMSTMVIYGVYGIVSSQNRAFGISGEIVEAQQNARALLDIMVREIRMAGYDPGRLTRTADLTFGGEQTDPGFVTALADEIRLVQSLGCTDCNEGGPGYGPEFVDNDMDDEFEDVTYQYLANRRQLRRNDVVLATDVDAFQFSYIFDDGEEGIPGVQADETDDADDIRAVRITLTTRTQHKHKGVEGDGYHRRTLSTLTKIRNMGL